MNDSVISPPASPDWALLLPPLLCEQPWMIPFISIYNRSMGGAEVHVDKGSGIGNPILLLEANGLVAVAVVAPPIDVLVTTEFAPGYCCCCCNCCCCCCSCCCCCCSNVEAMIVAAGGIDDGATGSPRPSGSNGGVVAAASLSDEDALFTPTSFHPRADSSVLSPSTP